MSRKGIAAFAIAVAILGIAVATVLVATSIRRPTDAELLALIQTHGDSLARVGDAMLRTEPGTRIDLRDPSAPVAPPGLREWVPVLRLAGIHLAEHDRELGGAILEVQGGSLSISGSATGIAYLPPLSTPPPRARIVADLDAGLSAARQNTSGQQAVKALFMRKVNDRWWLYLETF